MAAPRRRVSDLGLSVHNRAVTCRGERSREGCGLVITWSGYLWCLVSREMVGLPLYNNIIKYKILHYSSSSVTTAVTPPVFFIDFLLVDHHYRASSKSHGISTPIPFDARSWSQKKESCYNNITLLQYYYCCCLHNIHPYSFIYFPHYETLLYCITPLHITVDVVGGGAPHASHSSSCMQ